MSIGSVVSVPMSGRQGVVVGQTAIGETDDGKQRVIMQVQSRVPARGMGAQGSPTSSALPERAVTPASQASSGYEIRKPSIARDSAELTAEEQAAVDRLRQRDSQVKQEEKAHAAAAGASAGPISYTYTVGPDGRQYATGGSVSVRLSNPSGDPAKLVEAAARLSTAANAAHNPSAADLAAARKGYQVAGAALEVQHRNADITA